nr:glycerate kinase [uncultured Oscillibacter sp.]
MKKCIIISDSFKGTLSSLQICRIARETVSAFFPECQTVGIPVADGGEGTVDCFLEAIGAEAVTVPARGPYGESVQAVYARKGALAVIEMAAAAGLPMVEGRGDPSMTTTYGVGQMIRHAVENGCREILLGIGGSATNDGGCGCAASLGTRFYDESGAQFVPVGGTLGNIHHFDNAETKKLLAGVRVTVMCDVENPLYGPTGAAYVFAPQKGADEAMVRQLDCQLRALDRVFCRELGRSFADIPGAGAAGGLGAGCMAFLGAELRSGIEAVLDTVDFDRRARDADLIITGEGRIDSQSVHGKVISGIARRVRATGVPLVAIVGGIDESAAEAYDLGVTAMFSINREAKSFAESASKSAVNYQRTLADLCRLLRAMPGH